MRASVSLRLRKESDGTGALFAIFASGTFGGAGSAWFNLVEIEAFGRLLVETFPNQAASPIKLEGGNWSSSEPPQLAEVHLSLSIYPVGARGLVGLRIEVATPSLDFRPESLSRAGTELITSYQSIRAFGQAIQALCNGTAEVAALQGDDA